MNATQKQIGAVSNDLFRVVNLALCGSSDSAKVFLAEARKTSENTDTKNAPKHIRQIIKNISKRDVSDISKESIELYLLYGVLLQNHVLHSLK